MNLQELIADAVKRKGMKSPRRSDSKKTEDSYKNTKEQLRILALERCIPESIHLRITHQTCKCGVEYKAINSVPLVKCVGKNLTHYRPEENLEVYHRLPYFIETLEVAIPYCPECLPNVTHIEATPSKDIISEVNEFLGEIGI